MAVRFLRASGAAWLVAATCLLGVGRCAVAQTPPAAPAVEAASAPSHRNVYAAGGQVRPPGPTRGDFVAVGGRVIVDEPVGGDATLAGGAVDVRAPIGDDLRVAGGDVSIENTVGGELFASGGNVTVRPGSTIGGLARLYGGHVVMDGRVDGELRAGAQKITVNGEVRGDARLEGEAIELGPNARIQGALHYTSGAEIKKAAGATIAGAVVREQAKEASGEQDTGMRRERQVQGPAWAAGVISYLALLACAAVFLLIVPIYSRQAPERIRSEPWLSLAIGFGSLVAVPMLAVLLFVTLLGIPLGIAVMALYPVLLLAGFLVGVLYIAHWLPPALRKAPAASFKSSIGYFAVALLLVLLLGRLPVVGALLLGLVSVAGIGGCVLELYRRRREPIMVTT